MITSYRLLGGCFLSIMMFMVRCDEPNFPPSPYSRVTTLPIVTIDAEGVLFEADLTYLGTDPITDHGFLWSNKPTFPASGSLRVSLGVASALGKFDCQVTSGMIDDTVYHVKAFVTSGPATVFGDGVSFVSSGSKGPLITGFTPTEGTAGDTIKVTGEGLQYFPLKIIVRFGSTHYGNVLVSADSMLRATVPIGVTTGFVPITVIIADKSALAPGQFKVN